jgi:drug/metabolite transporter (DMT)-like permease
VFAWLFIGQAPTVLQALGGVVVVAGVALVRLGELRTPTGAAPALPVEEPAALTPAR